MKRIAIVTPFDNKNYGNRLQNLAVQHILTERGYVVDTIACDDGTRFRKHFVHLAVTCFRRYIQRQPLAKRMLSFYRFNRRHLRIRHFYRKDCKLPASLKNQYDYFVAGSDQIWNYTYQDNATLAMNFLAFADDHQKICLSPSIGVSLIDSVHTPMFRESLKGFRYLSCRERRGAEELTRVTGKECQWLIDPTLALTQAEWTRILDMKREERKPYVFAFFLAWITEELKQAIRDYADGRYDIIDPSDLNGRYYSVDPAEFVSLLANAHMVFTDSFHVAAFSINFHVPFYVFNRNKSTMMTSRIESLCSLFHQEDRHIRKQGAFEIVEICDFEASDRQLAEERRKFTDYLDRCLQA